MEVERMIENQKGSPKFPEIKASAEEATILIYEEIGGFFVARLGLPDAAPGGDPK